MATYKKSELTKSKITLTAARLFAEKGYKSTTIREICAASGVSQSRVNYHFTGKRELASDILNNTLEQIDQTIRGRVCADGEGGFAYAALYIRLWLGAFLAEDKYVRFCADLTDDGVFSRPIFEVYYRLFDAVNSRQALGLSAEEQRVAGYIFVSALSALIKSKYEGAWVRSNDAFCDTFVELFLKLLYVPRREIAALTAASRREKDALAAGENSPRPRDAAEQA